MQATQVQSLSQEDPLGKGIATHLSILCCSVAQLCPTLCDPMHCSTPGFPLLHHLPELDQTHVH